MCFLVIFEKKLNNLTGHCEFRNFIIIKYYYIIRNALCGLVGGNDEQITCSCGSSEHVRGKLKWNIW